jgi:hypothetical protein
VPPAFAAAAHQHTDGRPLASGEQRRSPNRVSRGSAAWACREAGGTSGRGAAGWLTRQAKEIPMTATTPGIELLPGGQPRLAAGSWRVDPERSYASFAARVAGWPVRGRLRLTGGVLIREPVEDSTARLAARASAVSTGSPGAWTGCWRVPASWMPGPSLRSASGQSCWSGFRLDGGPSAACRSRTPSMNWPASSICTMARRGRTAPVASLSSAAG